MEKIVRSLCLFRKTSQKGDSDYLNSLGDRMTSSGYTVQTRRFCFQNTDIAGHNDVVGHSGALLSIGGVSLSSACTLYSAFISARSGSLHVDLTNEEINSAHVDFLFQIIKDAPQKCFEFAFLFNGVPSSPFFPSANFEREGFSIGLQSTNLSVGCNSLEQWFENQCFVWNEICEIFEGNSDFLGIDSSVAPLYSGHSSLVEFLIKTSGSWDFMPISDTFLKITRHIKTKNPRPAGLCGLMLPCLEDFALADEYERGNFPIERNLFLSLHSGLGIDTYPIAVDESPSSVLKILQLLQGLSNKYKKCLSARFISDGVSMLGQKSRFNNPYLKDVHLRALIG